MSYSDAWELPITLQIDGKDVVVHPLTSRDYLSWVEQMTSDHRDKDRSIIPKEMKPVDKMRVLRNIEFYEATPADIGDKIYTIGVKIRILELALKKANVSDEAARKFIDGNTDLRNGELAVRLSGLYRQVSDQLPELEKGDGDMVEPESKTFASPLDGGGDPNAGTAPVTSPSAGNDPSSTGSSTESSSSATSTATL